MVESFLSLIRIELHGEIGFFIEMPCDFIYHLSVAFLTNKFYLDAIFKSPNSIVNMQH